MIHALNINVTDISAQMQGSKLSCSILSWCFSHRFKKKIFNNKTIGGNWKLSIIDGKFVGETVVKQEFSGSRER